MPHSVHAVMPSTRHPGEGQPLRAVPAAAGRRTATATASSSDRLGDADRQHHDDLAGEVHPLRHRRAAQPLEHAAVALDRDLDRQVLEADRQQAGGDHAGDEVLGELDARRDLAVEDRPEDDQQHDRERQREDHRLAAAQELLDLQPALRAAPARPGSRAVVGGRRGAVMPVSDHREVDVLEGRPGHGQAGDLAAEPRGQLGARRPSASRSPCARAAPSGPRQVTVAGALCPVAQLGRGGHRDQPAAGRSRRPGRPAPRPRPGSAWSAGSSCRPAARSRMSSQNSRRASGSKPVVGSSRKSSSGRPTMPSATSRRRFCPPERVWVRAPRLARPSPTRSITSSGSSASRVEARRSGAPPRPTVSSSNSPVPCSTMPTRARQARVGVLPGRRRARVTSPASRLR